MEADLSTMFTMRHVRFTLSYFTLPNFTLPNFRLHTSDFTLS